MADFRIALGGTISACTTDEMHSALGEVKSDILKGMSSGKAKRIMRPLAGSTAGATFSAGDTRQIKLGRPNSGRIWVVTRVVCLGEDDNTTHTNLVAALYIGDESTAGLGQCVRHGQSIPWTTTENENAYVVHDREDLFVKFTAIGSTTVANLAVNAIAWEYRDTDIDTQVI